MILDTNYWKTTGRQVPWGPFDKDAGLNFSFDLSAWVAASGNALTLSGVQVLADPRLTISLQSMLGAVFSMHIDKATPGAAADVGQFIPFTLRMTLSDGQHDDRTFYLLISER